MALFFALGGEIVLDRRCQKVIFLEDPHVARRQDADIQLLNRAVYSAGDVTTCFNTPAMTRHWARAMGLEGRVVRCPLTRGHSPIEHGGRVAARSGWCVNGKAVAQRSS